MVKRVCCPVRPLEEYGDGRINIRGHRILQSLGETCVISANASPRTLITSARPTPMSTDEEHSVGLVIADWDACDGERVGLMLRPRHTGNGEETGANQSRRVRQSQDVLEL
jgi:hypothetical protein